MDDVFIQIIKSSQVLPERLKTLLIYTGEKKIRKDGYSYLSVGDAYEIVRKCEALYGDLKNIEVTDKIYCYLFYTVLNNYCDFDINIYSELIELTFFNSTFRSAVLKNDSSNSAFVSYLKAVAPKIEEMTSLIDNRQSLQVLKVYKEILDLCNAYGISSELDDEVLKTELEKRFSFNNPIINIKKYKKVAANPEFSKENKEDLTAFTYAKSYSPLLYALQKVLYEKSLKYYNETGCFFRQYNDGINIYLLGDITIIAYKYDEIPNMALKTGNLILTWKDRDFWAKIFDPKMDFVNDTTVSYFIDDLESPEYYTVESLEFKNAFFKGAKVLFAPEEYLDEALLKSLTGNGTLPLDHEKNNLLMRIGFNPDNLTDKLMSADNSFFFKNPSLVDELKIKNIDNFTHLGLIKLKTNTSSRNRCIASIRAASRKNPKKPELLKKKKPYGINQTKERTYRLPYKDN